VIGTGGMTTIQEALRAADITAHLRFVLSDISDPSAISTGGWDGIDDVPVLTIKSSGGNGPRLISRLRSAYNVAGRGPSNCDWIESLLLISPLHLRLAAYPASAAPLLFRVDVQLT
jgi:hypothetical protein